MNGVHNNEIFLNIKALNSLVDTVSSYKEFSFSGHNIDSMMQCLDNWSIIIVDVRDQGSNLTFNASIYNNGD